jgi:hypothetical protein
MKVLRNVMKRPERIAPQALRGDVSNSLIVLRPARSARSPHYASEAREVRVNLCSVGIEISADLRRAPCVRRGNCGNPLADFGLSSESVGEPARLAPVEIPAGGGNKGEQRAFVVKVEWVK